MSSLFFGVCIPVAKDSSNVQEFKNKIHFVTDFITVYTKSVGLQVPGNIILHSLSFILFPLHSQTSPLGFEKDFPSHDDMQISLTTFLTDGTKLLPVTPLPTKRNNKQREQQTIETNE